MCRQDPKALRFLSEAERTAKNYPDWSLIPGLPLIALAARINSNQTIDDYEPE